MSEGQAVAFKKREFHWYNYSKLLSHNAVYNMVVGPRGNGKTYGAKKRCIKKAIQGRGAFIYLRRYQSEMVPAKDTFFADISHEFPEVEFRINGNKGEFTFDIGPEVKKKKWNLLCYFIVLSKAQSYKSVSFATVTDIIFDEFIIENGVIRYLPEEVKIFNNFFSTVDRNQDKTRVLFLANAVKIMNPYFGAFSVDPDREWQTKFDGFVVVHIIKDSVYAEQVSSTRFGRFIAGSDYADYAVNNEFSDNNRAMVGPKNPDAEIFFSLQTEHGLMTVWLNMKEKPVKWYFTSWKPTHNLIYTMSVEDISEDVKYIDYNDGRLKHLRTAYGHGNCVFESPKIRNMAQRIWKR